MATFDDATLVHGTDGAYTAELDPTWTVGGRPHGGYLLATMARAAVHAAGAPGSEPAGTRPDQPPAHPHPLSASAVYLASPTVGPAAVTVEILRRGRLVTQARARLSQSDQVRVEALFTLGQLTDDREASFVDVPPPDVAPFESCPRSPIEPRGVGVRVAMLDLVEQRLDRASFGRHDRQAENPFLGGSGEIRGWLRLADEASFDPFSLLYAADAFPPATFTLGSVGWVPTLELTVYVRGLPAPGPLRVRQRARVLSGSLVDQVCEVWDAKDRIVVQATQLAAVRMDPSAIRR